MTGVALLLLIGGATLVYSAFKGTDPRSLFSSVFTGNPPDMLQPLPGAPQSVGGAMAGFGSALGNTLTGGKSDSATPAAASWMRYLDSRFQGLRHSAKAIKLIAGTKERSQHSYGNAVDTFGDKATMEAIWRYAIANATAHSARLIIYNRQQWYAGKVSRYTGVNPHTGHVHVDFYPEYCGTQPGHPCQGLR